MSTKLNLGYLSTVWASLVLPPGAKGHWEKHLWLDQGADGCFMGAAEMGELLGMKAATVEAYRQRFDDLGMLRKGESGKRRHWFVAFPEGIDPPLMRKGGGKVKSEMIVAAARRLDQHIIGCGGWAKAIPSSGNGPSANPDAGMASGSNAGTVVRAGGLGGSSIEVRENPSHLSGISTDRRTVQPERNCDRRNGRDGFRRIGSLIVRSDSA